MDGKITNEDIYQLIKKLETQNNQMREDLNNFKKDLNERLVGITEENKIIKKENAALRDQLNILEQQTKKYNIIIYGVEEPDTELEDIQHFLNITNKKLDINCRYDDIRDLHRIGRNIEGKQRPLKIELVNFQLKKEILSKAKYLKGTNTFISNDYTKLEYEKQKTLRKHLRTARESNKKATIRKNILYIDDKSFTYEELQRQDQTRENQSTNQGKYSGKEPSSRVEQKTQGTEEYNPKAEKNKTRKKSVVEDPDPSTKRFTRQDLRK